MERLTIRHILLLISCCIFSGTAVGITGNCMGQFVTPLSNALGEQVGTVTIFITLTFLSSAFFGPFITKIMNKVHMRVLMSVGILVNVGCIFLLSIVQNIYILYIVAIVLGIANVCFNLVPITLLLNNWFYKNIGLFTGICASFSGVVGAVFNPIVARWIEILGYRTTFMICGVIVLVFSLPCALFFVEYRPEDIGLLPYGYNEVQKERPNGENEKKHIKVPFLILILVIIYSIVQNAVSGLNPSVAAMAQSIPLEAGLSGTMVSAAMTGNVISKLSLGVLSDRFGAKFGISTMMITGAVGLVILSILRPSSYWLALFGCLIYGCVFSCMANGAALLMREIYDPIQFEKYYPTVSMFSNVAYAVSVAIVGKSYDLFGTYRIIEIGLAILSLCAVAFLMYIYRMIRIIENK